MFAALQIPESVLGKVVPKHVLTLQEVEFALGGSQRVKHLRQIGALVGKRDGTSVVFQSSHVAQVSAEFFAGKYDAQLEGLRR